MEINYINKLGRKHYICKEEHLKSESSLETVENILTKRKEERVETFVADLLGLEEAGG